MNSYKNLDIYNLAYSLAIKVHKISLTLPKQNFMNKEVR